MPLWVLETNGQCSRVGMTEELKNGVICEIEKFEMSE